MVEYEHTLTFAAESVDDLSSPARLFVFMEAAEVSKSCLPMISINLYAYGFVIVPFLLFSMPIE